MKKLISTANMSREEWLEWRRKGIGGSDAAALVGLSAWSSPFSVYADKLGLLPDREDNEAMRQGRDLEEYVAQRFTEETGKRVHRCNAIIVHPAYDFLLANVDRLVSGEDSGLECKTMSPRNPAAAALEDGDVPPQYYAQCQHYMSVTGYSKWYLAILVLGVGFYWFEILRNDEDISVLLDAEIKFWRYHVIVQEPPAPDDSASCSEVLKGLYPIATSGKEVVLACTWKRLHRLSEIKEETARLEQERQGIENEICAQMREAETAHAPGWRVTYKNRTRVLVDGKQLKAGYPDIYEQCKKVSTYRVLAVREEE